MAPELIKRQRTDQRIDVFSYAATCYETWAKRLPWEAAETLEAVLQHINVPAADIRKFAPKINDTIADTIMQGLSLYPDDRWQSIGEMLAKFRKVYNRRLKSDG
jgi:serine/threonine protein kinase